MSSTLMPVLQAIVRSELPPRPGLSVGSVTSVTTNEGGAGDHNLEVNVRLHGSDLELQRVAVSVGRLGLSLVPRVGDLAVVGFVDGDPNGAVVLGFLYDHELHPPDAGPDEVVYLVPDDASSKRRFELQLANGNLLTVTDAKVTVKMGGTTLVVEGDGNITLDAAGDLVLKAAGSVKMQAGGNVDIEAGANLTAKASASATLEGTGSAKVKGAVTTIAGTTSFSPG